MACEVSAATATTTNETSAPSEELALWGLQRGEAHVVGLPSLPCEGGCSDAMFLSSDRTPEGNITESYGPSAELGQEPSSECCSELLGNCSPSLTQWYRGKR